VYRLKDVTAQAKEIRAAAVACPVHLYRNDLLDSAGRGSHDNDAVAHVDGFIDIMIDPLNWEIRTARQDRHL